MRSLLVLSALLLSGCGLFSGKNDSDYPSVSYGKIHDRSGGLHPNNHCVLTRWDDKFYYFEWRRIVEPATRKTKDGNGRVKIQEFDKKNGRPLERKKGVIGKEDTTGLLYNAGMPT